MLSVLKKYKVCVISTGVSSITIAITFILPAICPYYNIQEVFPIIYFIVVSGITIALNEKDKLEDAKKEKNKHYCSIDNSLRYNYGIMNLNLELIQNNYKSALQVPNLDFWNITLAYMSYEKLEGHFMDIMTSLAIETTRIIKTINLRESYILSNKPNKNRIKKYNKELKSQFGNMFSLLDYYFYLEKDFNLEDGFNLKRITF